MRVKSIVFARKKNMHLKPGCLVVFEGLDSAGKTTQVDELCRRPWREPAPYSVHMPAGLTRITKEVYSLLETDDMSSPLGRQLLHLACHAETIGAISEQLEESAVVLDRWWWSTVAYGWYGADLRASVPKSVFYGLIDTIWRKVEPDLVLLFLDSRNVDHRNTANVVAGYQHLGATSQSTVEVVPRADIETTTDWILEQLRNNNLIQP